MILFVAANPSKLNKSPEIAMISAKCEGRFNEWAKFLSPDGKYAAINVSDKILEPNKALKKSDFNLERLKLYTSSPSFPKVVALGKTACDALDMLGVSYYALPHPSPLNRFLNNTVQVQALLLDCKQWLEAKCQELQS